MLTPTEALQARERQWSKRLAAVSLAAEYQVNPDHAAQMLGVLGANYRKFSYNGYRRSLALRVYPAVQVLSTTNAAIGKYDGHGFWPKLAGLLQISNSPAFQQEWGQAFLDNLATLGLPTFANADADAGTRYLGRILLHCGVPTWCLDDFYRVVTEQRTRHPALDAESFVAWAASRAAAGRLYDVDMPVNRFLRFGGEFAIDVTDRIFELLDIIGAGGDGSEIPLPDRFRLKALELHQAGRLEPARARGTRGGKLYPHLVLDPYGRGPLLQLPPVGDAPDGRATWVVTLDGDPQRVGTQALWPGSSEPAPATSVPIPRPIRVASAALEGREHLTANVSVVDDNDPFLAFGEDGVCLPSGLALPGSLVWLLVPGDSSGLVFEGEPRVVTETALPPGWSQWSLTLVDLADVRSVRFGTDGKAHTIRTFSAAHIEVGQPLVGVRTLSGAPVFTELPEIVLPQGLGADANWEVSILDSKGSLIRRTTFKSGQPTTSLWTEQQRPILGSFTIRARGPWGRGASRTVFIAEGLQVRSSPSWRRLSPDGLVPATVTVSTPAGMDVDHRSVSLSPRQRDRFITVSAGSQSTTLAVSPPHMTIAYQSTETTTRPSVRALTLYTEDVVADAGTLILDVGANAQPALSIFTGSQSLQTLEPGAGRQGVYRFNLAQIVDTLNAHKQLALSLGAEGQLPIASIRPKRLFSAVSMAGPSLEFDDCADVSGLVALIYASRAPWRTAAVVPIENGAALLPDDLQEAGPLLVTARVDDPWAPEPVPDWPELGQSRFVNALGWLLSDDAEESAVSAFLAGVRGLPEHITDFTRLWTIRATLPELGLGDREIHVRDTVEAAMFRQPRPALMAMAQSSVPTEEIPALVIRSGLAWANLAAAHDDAPPTWTPRGALAAVLLSAADAEWSPEEVDAAIEVCGDVVTTVMEGSDLYAKSGRFDDGADIYAHNPAQRDAFVAMMGLVPQGLLGSDTRVIAAMELISRRNDRRLDWLLRNARSVLAVTEKLLAQIAAPEVYASFQARKHPTRNDGWRAIPAISIGLAIAARYAARGHDLAVKHMEYLRRGWVDLATVVPQLVTIDLVLAELLVAAAAARTKEQSS
ncbi:hypothetical protein ACIA58_33190 [Kribbella sp. NPDC051586]|uniref:hypothetical protein n=1 Tax=Kribbella sp. NPDC051586 TaxID=3364118 RepID=UPI00379C4589